ncbi:hypothetical protein K431DRAFT_10540 [Polychaeton citri CBS 116435]|uniref:Zn(2)-C6 fungal-type domain-containing protein n=1 Tax=Polychaeton citri CBS 116435 TaxID=1314669 RepID=A0A9P4QD17_9PEZI|nr:hypothetical protein K431DRAFT_10540 [Polychaeton citri CBS 116435]
MAPKGVSNPPSSSSPSSHDKVYRFISDPEHKETLSGRVRAACLTCRRKKIKCSGDEPCQTCRDRGLKCEGLPPRKRARRLDPYQSATSPGRYHDDGESVIDSLESYSIDSSTSRQNSVGGASNRGSSLVSTQPLSRSPVLNISTRSPPQASPTGFQNAAANVAANASGYGVFQSQSPRRSQEWSASPVAGPSTWTSEVHSRNRGINQSPTVQSIEQMPNSHGKRPVHQNSSVAVDANTQIYPIPNAVSALDAPATVDNLALLFPGCFEPPYPASPQSNLDDSFNQQPFQSPTVERNDQSLLPFERAETQLTPNWDAWNASIQQRDLQRQASQVETEGHAENSATRPTVARRTGPRDGYLFSRSSQRPWPYDQ